MLVSRVHKPFHCRICGSTSQIKVCKCQKAYYCSKNCQKIDWRSHKSECYDLVKYPNTFQQNSSVPQTNNDQLTHNIHILESQISSSNLQQQNFNYEREGQSYFPPPHQHAHDTNTTNMEIETPTCTATDDFEENLFNSLLFSVDESTEREILNNLDIGDEDLLRVCELDGDNALSFDDQTVLTVEEDDQVIDEETFAQIQRKKSCEYQPEAQKLLKETRENLEKELSMFREINLSEANHQLDLNGEDVKRIMQFKNNPKYQVDAKLDDHLIR